MGNVHTRTIKIILPASLLPSLLSLFGVGGGEGLGRSVMLGFDTLSAVRQPLC